jgi:hypothetical protein
MEEFSHHVDLRQNILRMRQTAPGGRFKYHLNGLARNEVGQRSEGTKMAALAKPVPTVLEETPNMEDSNADLTATVALYVKLAMAVAQRSPETVEMMVPEIVDEETIQLDCATLWVEVFGSEAAIMEDNTATNIPEFECRILAPVPRPLP